MIWGQLIPDRRFRDFRVRKRLQPYLNWHTVPRTELDPYGWEWVKTLATCVDGAISTETGRRLWFKELSHE